MTSRISLLVSRGIDYMLQAKLADARAREAEQKLEGRAMRIYKIHQ